MADGTDSETSKPTPDPTVLTTAQLLREIETLKDYVDTQGEGHRLMYEERMQELGRRIDDTRQQNAQQFEIAEQHRLELKADNEKALTTALTAAEKAVQAALAAAEKARDQQTIASQLATTKAETAFVEQLKQQSATFTLAITGVTSTLNDLKDRVARAESIKVGATETKETQRLNLGALVGLATLVVLLLSTAVGLIVAAVTP